MTDTFSERFYPATADETFSALVEAATAMCKVRSIEEFTRSVRYSTRASGFSWGSDATATVFPSEDGASVRIVGSRKMWANFVASGSEQEQVENLLDHVGDWIQVNRGD